MPPVRLLRQVNATASSAGTATFTFPSVEEGGAWTGTLSIPTAPTAGSFTAEVGVPNIGVVWGAWTGNATFGPIQAYGRETIVVLASGLTAATTYSCALIGQRENENEALPVSPTALATAVSSVTPVTASHYVQVSRAALVALADSVQLIVPWTVTDFDTDGYVTGTTLTVPAGLAGVYELTGGATMNNASAAAGFFEVVLLGGGTTAVVERIPIVSTTIEHTLPVAPVRITLAVGDLIRMGVTETSGGAANLYSNAQAGHATWMRAALIT